MSFVIAVSGKGGVGKTTVAALLVSRLIARGHTPVLAVDADPNSCLDRALGVEAKNTVGRVREQAKQISGGEAAGISKPELLRMKIAESLVEARDFDLIAMGRPEGPGCYCYANSVLKSALAELSRSYPFMVLDNEAGLENLSRRLSEKADLLILVSDPSHNGLTAVRRLYQLAGEMEIRYSALAVVINRLRRDKLPEGAADLKAAVGADFLVGLPDNSEIAEASERGESMLNLPAENPLQERLGLFLEEALDKVWRMKEKN